MTRNPARIHVDPSSRTAVGLELARQIRLIFVAQAKPGDEGLPVCPGCTMIALFDAFVALSIMDDFPLRHCAPQLGSVLAALAETPDLEVYALAEALR